MIQIQNVKKQLLPVEVDQLRQAVLETLQYTHTAGESGVTLVLSDDSQLRQLNRDFMGIDAATDVLSFPADFVDPDNQEVYLGDIVISVPRAIAQAEENQVTPASELILLTVHGTLHLLGYDHASPQEKDAMWAVQTAILECLK